jgi:hypothetical protein
MKLPFRQEFKLDNIELFMEDQAFSLSYELAPNPPPPLLFRQEIVPLSQSTCVSPVELTDKGGGGRGAKSYGSDKVWSSLNNFILFVEMMLYPSG